MKIRHILLVLLAMLAIAFMQPLVSFLGGLTLLLGVGGLIFRDLSPASQDAMERRLLGWLRRARADSTPATHPPASFHQRLPTNPAAAETPVAQVRRSRIKSPASRPATGSPPATAFIGDTATGDNLPPPAV